MTGTSHKSVLVDPRMVVTYNQAPIRMRVAYIIGGVSADGRSLTINNPDVDTLAAALLERMYYCKVDGAFVEPPQPAYDTIDTVLKEFRRKLLRHARVAPKVSPEQFVEMYDGRKRTIYEAALPEFYAVGVLTKHAMSIVFVKCEKVKPGSAPRCIQPRSSVYNIGLGMYLKPNEHLLYKAVKRVFGEGQPIVMKGMNVRQVAVSLKEKWDHFGHPVAVGLDAVKFDMHVSESMLKWEHSIYTLLMKDLELKRLLRMQLKNKGVGFCDNGKIRYSVDGRRFSGDMNTGLGNCLIMCALVWSYCKERQVEIRFANNGDDCVVIMETHDLQRFNQGLDQWFLNMGFRMTVEKPVYTFEEIEFCQMHPVYTVNGWVMVRNLSTAREKDSMSLLPLDSKKAFQKWIYAVGECGLALTSGVPVFQSMYLAYTRAGIPSRMGAHPAMQTGARILARGLQKKTSVIIPEARVSFFSAWGVTPDEQLCLEAYYDSLVLEYDVRAIDSVNDLTSAPL